MGWAGRHEEGQGAGQGGQVLDPPLASLSHLPLFPPSSPLSETELTLFRKTSGDDYHPPRPSGQRSFPHHPSLHGLYMYGFLFFLKKASEKIPFF
jgi:hypothetical protein